MLTLPSPSIANDWLEHALGYAELGWPILPVHSIRGGCCSCGKVDCPSKGKHPRLPNGCRGASSDPETIRGWSDMWPDANIGVATGPEAGIWVLDVDGDAGRAALDRLVAEHGALPTTPMARTGGGGGHYVFAQPAGAPVGCKIRVGDMPIDVRGAGGYVVVPPSRHASGSVYEWLVAPGEAAIAAAPDWLIRLVTGGLLPGEKIVLRVSPSSLDESPGVEQGHRHRELIRLVAGEIRRGGGRDEVLAKALAWGRRCRPPMDEAEVARDVDDMAGRIAAGSPSAGPHAWEPPIPFDDHERPPFPLDALSPRDRAFVKGLATATQTPADLAGMLVLGAGAAACGGLAEVVVNESYFEPLNRFVAVAMPPASRKSAVFAEVTAPLTAYERDEAARVAPEIAEFEAFREIGEANLKQLKSDILKAAPQEREEIAGTIAELARELSDKKVPVLPRLLADDVTAERLAGLLSEQGGRMAVMSPEGDAFDIMSGRYSKGSNFGVYLKGHAGDMLRVDRVHRPTDYVSRPALTVALALQPDVIRGLTDNPGFRGRGLLARFLYAMPKSTIGRRDTDPPPLPEATRQAYRSKVLSLLKFERPSNDAGQPAPHALRLTAAAYGRYNMLATEVEGRLDPEVGDLAHIGDWGGKLVGAVMRIAGILHMSDHAEEDAPWETPIEAGTVDRAAAIGRYLVAHALVAFAEMGVDPTVEQAAQLWTWIASKGAGRVSRRDLFEGNKGRFRTVDAMQPAIDLLVTHGYLREAAAPPRSGPGRRPSPVYEVNPLAAKARNPHRPTGATTVEAPSYQTGSMKGVTDAPDDDQDELDVEFEEGII